jgi:hypothetical protein
VVLLIVMALLLLVAFAVLPFWPYSARWGCAPAGACGALVAGVAALILLGRL